MRVIKRTLDTRIIINRVKNIKNTFTTTNVVVKTVKSVKINSNNITNTNMTEGKTQDPVLIKPKNALDVKVAGMVPATKQVCFYCF